MFRNERTHNRQNTNIRSRESADRQLTGLAVGRLPGKAGNMVQPSQDFLHSPQKNAPGASQRDVMTATFKEWRTHRVFELPDLLAE